MDKAIKVDATLDCFGLICPVPIYLTAKKLKEMNIGETLEVSADDEETIHDIPAFCRDQGQKFLKFKEENGLFKFYIEKVKD